MTFTWDPSLLGSSPLQQTRQTVGDTNETDQLMSDEQIDWRLSQYDNDVPASSIRVVQDILAKLARDFDRSNQGFSATRSQKITHYQDVLKQLKAESGTLAEIFVGGLSKATEKSFHENEDWKPNQFGIGIDDNKSSTS